LALWASFTIFLKLILDNPSLTPMVARFSDGFSNSFFSLRQKSLILIIAMDAILDWLNSVSQDVIEQSKMEAEKSKQAKNTKANRLN
jgi:hypothetical protein